MTKSTNLNWTQEINADYAEFVNGDGSGTGSRQTLFTADASDGSLLKNLICTSDDTADMILVVEYYDGTNYIPLCTKTIPDGSGTNGTDYAVDLLNTTDMPFLRVDNNDNPYLPVGAGHTITGWISTTAVTSAKTVHTLAIGEDY